MRAWIYNRVKACAGLDAEYAGNVISSGSGDNPQGRFLLIAMNPEQPALGLPAAAQAQGIPFTVYVYAGTDGDMVSVDNACIALKNGIPTEDGVVVGNMSVYQVKWEESGEDGYDDHFNRNVRPVRFSMMTKSG